jgi:hypothetical protein
MTNLALRVRLTRGVDSALDFPELIALMITGTPSKKSFSSFSTPRLSSRTAFAEVDHPGVRGKEESSLLPLIW